jgi:hypothetical protein
MTAQPRQIHLKATAMTYAEAEALTSLSPDPTWYDTLIQGEDTEVYKPDGSLLVKLCAGAVNLGVGKDAYTILSSVALAGTKNRGSAMGKSFKMLYIKDSDGTVSKTDQSCDPRTGKTIKLDSSILGYFDRNARFLFCRQVNFLANSPQDWAALQPYIKEVDKIFRAAHPERYAVQRAWADATAPDFMINGTAFTTITVNKNWATAVHRDAGDLKQGFGVITCLRGGVYRGGHLVFPQWRVAVDLQSCDVLLFDPHEWHGNTRIQGAKSLYQRITCVFYYRKNMIMAGDSRHELTKAQNRKPGDPIWSREEQQRLSDMEALYPVP